MLHQWACIVLHSLSFASKLCCADVTTSVSKDMLGPVFAKPRQRFPIAMNVLCVAPGRMQADAHVIVHGMAAAGLQHLQVTTDALSYLTKSGEQKGQRLGHHDVQPLQVDRTQVEEVCE